MLKKTVSLIVYTSSCISVAITVESWALPNLKANELDCDSFRDAGRTLVAQHAARGSPGLFMSPGNKGIWVDVVLTIDCIPAEEH